MKYTTKEILNPKNALGQLLMASDICSDVVNTKQFIEDKEIEIKVSYNGVDIDHKHLVEILEDYLGLVEQHFKDKYSDIESEIQDRVEKQVEELMEDQVQSMLDSFQELQHKLDDVNRLVKYKWEK